MAFPQVAQVFRITRTVTRLNTRESSVETVYGVTSLPSLNASPERLLAYVRNHWSLEAHHWTRDVTFGEDRSAVRTRSAPQNMASLRNLVVGLIRLWENARDTFRDLPVVMRRSARFPEEALAILGL